MPVARPLPQLTPRPIIDQIANLALPEPDFHDELRWPLTPMNHPVLEPKFPIAQELAQPGVGWLQLCDRGITNRYGRDQELLSYLRGWCKAIDGDVDAACGQLAPLIHTKTPRLEAAVRNDLANILSQGHADDAEHFIRVYSMRDVGLLDLLAAKYVEVGTTNDALAMNRAAIDTDDYAPPATKCIRWTRHIVLSNDRTSVLMKNIEAYTGGKHPDETCVREWHKLHCWAVGSCQAFYTDEGVKPSVSELAYAYNYWPQAHTSNDWWLVADGAMFSNAEPGFADLAVAAAENALKLDVWEDGACSDGTRKLVTRYAPVWLGQQNAELSKRVEALKIACQKP